MIKKKKYCKPNTVIISITSPSILVVSNDLNGDVNSVTIDDLNDYNENDFVIY